MVDARRYSSKGVVVLSLTMAIVIGLVAWRMSADAVVEVPTDIENNLFHHFMSTPIERKIPCFRKSQGWVNSPIPST